MDFGLSRHDRLPDLLDEEFELPMGTGPYMSPEQVQFVRNDPRSDLFALGVLMYHLATGERPSATPNTVAGCASASPRAGAAARAAAGDSALDAGDHPALPGRRAGRSPPDRRAARLRSAEPHAGQAHRARPAHAEEAGGLTTLKRRFSAVGSEPVTIVSAAEQTERSPIIAAAVDVAGATPALLEAVRQTAQRLLQTEPGARLACLAVMKTNRIATDDLMEADGSSKHVNLLVKAQALGAPDAEGAGAAAARAQAGASPTTCSKAPDAASDRRLRARTRSTTS